MDRNSVPGTSPTRLPSLWLLPDSRTYQYCITTPQQTNNNYLSLLEPIIAAMDQHLKELDTQSRAAVDSFASLQADLHVLLPIPRLPSLSFRYSLQIVDFPTPPLYVQRRFDLAFRVAPCTGVSVPLLFPLQISVSVWKTTPGNEEITRTRKGQNHTGTAILRGQMTKTFTEETELIFKGIAFDDVTSIFPMGRVDVVLKCGNREDVRPARVEGVRVKARKRRENDLF